MPGVRQVDTVRYATVRYCAGLHAGVPCKMGKKPIGQLAGQTLLQFGTGPPKLATRAVGRESPYICFECDLVSVP